VARGVFGERGGLVPYPGYKQDRADDAARAATRWAVRLANAMQDPDDVEALDLARRRALRAAWWAERTLSDRVLWPGNVRNSMIGQGDVLLTPLQVARIASLVATGGRPPRPRLTTREPMAFDSIELDPEILAQVRRGMELVVRRGTASKSSIGLRGHDVAGKTGTAERRKGDPYLAWFMGYYPASAPEVAFAVLVDRTRGHGGGVCAPVARELLLAYEKSQGREGLR
jgi:cell division protein FtsI/penicillin-binding protein 2